MSGEIAKLFRIILDFESSNAASLTSSGPAETTVKEEQSTSNMSRSVLLDTLSTKVELPALSANP